MTCYKYSRHFFNHEGTKPQSFLFVGSAIFRLNTMNERADQLSGLIIGAAIEVHRCLGPGLLESAYEKALVFELQKKGLQVRTQEAVPVIYKGHDLQCNYRLDLLVEGLVIIELKSVEKLLPIHKAQVITYLKLKRLWLGLLINFNVPVLKQGIIRVVN
ncbi:GxxExxY protein [Kistimonas scapharcae]